MKLQSIKSRMVVMVALMVVIIVTTISVIFFTTLVSQERQLFENQLRQSGAELITASLDHAIDDVRLLAASPPIQGIVRTAGGTVDEKSGLTRQQWREQLVAFFREFLDKRSSFFQIRLIGFADDGLELVRVERDPLSRLPVEAGLQAKGARPYVKAALDLREGEVYLSPLNLNVEHGVLEVPHRPVMRAVTPVFSAAGERFGLVVINVDMSPLLSRLEKLSSGNRRLYLTNESGDYLMHPRPERSFGFDLGRRIRLQDEFPGTRDFMRASQQGSELIRVEALATRLLHLQRIYLPARDHSRYLVLVNDSDIGGLFVQTALLWKEVTLITLFTVLVVAAVAWHFAARLITPLGELAKAAQALAAGEVFTSLPTDREDELGHLARSFERMAQDVLERERELRTVAQRMMMAEEIAALGNWTWDLQTDVVELSPVACRIRGLPETAEGFAVERVLASIHETDRERIRNVIYNAVREGRDFDVSYRLDGAEERYVHVLGRPDSGSLNRYLGTSQDVTEQLQLQARLTTYATQLELSNRELSEFAYVASHDLQEPLRKIQAFGDRLASRYRDVLDDDGVDYLRRMQDASARMARLISDLLEYSRLSTQAKPKEKVDLNRVVKEVCSDLSVTIDELGADVNVETLPVICGEPTHMRQLMQNLIGNALKFSRPDEPPWIRVASEVSTDLPSGLERGRPYVCLSIIDNGIGFDMAYVERIFQPFQRLHGRDDFPGTGIGLATCRKIVEQHGGLLTAESAPGDGACFRVYLPACDDCAYLEVADA